MSKYKLYKYNGNRLEKSDFNHISKNGSVYIYGAGLWGIRTFCLMRQKGIEIKKFIVSDLKINSSTVFGLDVVEYMGLETSSYQDYIVIAFSADTKFQVARDVYNDGYVNTFLIDGIEHENWIDALMPKEYYAEALERWYYGRTKCKLDLLSPRTFNEKIQWLKLFDSSALKTKLADKLQVRDWVKTKIGKEYLIPLLGAWDRFDDINFDALPKQFVLKCNHGSGYNLIVENKHSLLLDKEREKFNEWMNTDFGLTHGFQLHYCGIPRKIIAEEYLKDNEMTDIKDYKVFVFDGEAKMIQVDIDRYGHHRRNLYTTDWNRIDGEIGYLSAPDVVINKPKMLDKILDLAEILGKNFKHVRVDFYIVREHIFFGEMTFTHGSGTEIFKPKELEMQMGDWIKVSK